MKLIFLLSVMLLLLLHQTASHPYFLSDQFINEINALNTTWTAGRNFPENTPIDYLKALASGVILEGKDNLPLAEINTTVKLPINFDARKQWSKCPTIGQISNQSPCRSCWAFSTTGAMSDRRCIKSSRKSTFVFSAQNLFTCCAECMPKRPKLCKDAGGDPFGAWKYWTHAGIVSGGPYHSGLGCQPYEFAPKQHNPTFPPCKKTCGKNYKIPYKKDLHFGIRAYQVKNKVSQIQKEVYFHGPVVAVMAVFEDFFSYKYGVYRHKNGKQVGLHAVRIIGWGVEKKVPYWLAANSWGTKWGLLGGFFKILRGKNECKIETYLTAGTPKV